MLAQAAAIRKRLEPAAQVPANFVGNTSVFGADSSTFSFGTNLAPRARASRNFVEQPVSPSHSPSKRRRCCVTSRACWLACVTLLLADCGVNPPPATGPACGIRSFQTEVAGSPRYDKIDVLFVVDNAPSMAPKQEFVRDHLTRLISMLLSDQPMPDYPWYEPLHGSIHFGVVSADLGVGGDSTQLLTATPRCLARG
jgi:hypothetical protein